MRNPKVGELLLIPLNMMSCEPSNNYTICNSCVYNYAT